MLHCVEENHDNLSSNFHSMEQSTYWEACSHSGGKDSSPIMELCWQKPAAGPYPEAVLSSPYPRIVIKIQLSSHPWLCLAIDLLRSGS
jgi:hypothetical protein